MSRTWRIAAFLAGTVLSLCGSFPAFAADPAAANRPIRLAFEPTPNPPRYLGEGTAIDWHHPGLTLELLRLVESQLGITFSYERMPWKRALYLLETNEIDGVFHASFVPERMQLGVYPMTSNGEPDPTRAIFDQSYAFYRLRGSGFGWDGKTVVGADLPVGVTIGYSVINDLKRLGIAIEEDRGKAINLIKLLNHRISAVADLENMTDIFLRHDPVQYAAVEKIPTPIVSKPYYLLLSHGFYGENPRLAEYIWGAIRSIKESEAFDSILYTYSE